VGLLLDPHPSFHPAGPTCTLCLAQMGSSAIHPAPREDVGLISQAGGHTVDVTVTCGHILFSGCTRALFLLNSQSFIDTKPFPFSPPPSMFYLFIYLFLNFVYVSLFPPLNCSSTSDLSNISAWSLFSQKKLTDNSFIFFFSQEPYKLHAKHCT